MFAVLLCCVSGWGCSEYDPIPRAGIFEREANRISENLAKPAPAVTTVKPGLPIGVGGGAVAPRQGYVLGQSGSADLLQGLTDAPIGVDLRFEDAEIAPVVTTVIGDVLKKPYSVDSSLKGKVSLVVSRNTTQRGLMEILREAVMRVGGDIRRSGVNYEVLNVGDNRIDDQRIAQLRASNTSVSFVPLRNARASTVNDMLKAIYPTAGQITVDENSNMLIIQGPPAQRAQIQETAELLDVGGASNKSVAVFPLSQGNAAAVADELRRIYGPQSGPQGSNVEVVPIPRNNSVMVIARQQSMLSRAGQLIRGLDVQRSAGRRMYVVPLQNARAPLLAGVLRESLGLSATTATSVSPLSTTPTGQPSTMSTSPYAGAPVPALTGAAPGALTGATSAGGPPPAEVGVGAGPGAAPFDLENVPLRIVANADTNALIIFATPGEYSVIADAIRKLDTAPLQVLIEATVMDVALNDSLQFGVQAFLNQVTSAGNLAQLGVTASSFATQGATTSGFNFIFSNPQQVQVAVNALRAVTKVTVLSSPQVVTLDNQRAKLEVGSQVPITTQQVIQTVTPGAPVVNSISYVQTGVLLLVTPRVNSSGSVDLDIRQEVTDAPNASSTLTPILNRRVIETRVSVQSTQTVALGGLITEGLTDQRDRVPLLGDIPVVGWMFGQTATRRQKQELLVFLTPTVFANPDEARNFSLELRRRLDAMWSVEGSPRRRP